MSAPVLAFTRQRPIHAMSADEVWRAAWASFDDPDDRIVALCALVLALPTGSPLYRRAKALVEQATERDTP